MLFEWFEWLARWPVGQMALQSVAEVEEVVVAMLAEVHEQVEETLVVAIVLAAALPQVESGLFWVSPSSGCGLHLHTPFVPC